MFSRNKLYLHDLKVIQEAIPNIEKLRNKSILITGSCGLICSAIVDFLIYINDTLEYDLHVFAAARPQDHIEKRFLGYINRKDFHYISYDANKPFVSNEYFDYIIHGASNANPILYVKEPVETMLSNFIGLENMLKYALKNNTKRVLYISSSEVYGNKTNNLAYKEDNYGYIDILNPRACYPSSKRASETLAIAYKEEYDIDAVIVRPGHVYGPTCSPLDKRAASQFARDVIEGHDIIMKSKGNQLRSHCYVMDCISAILTVLLNGKSGEAYNISSPKSISTIREIAESYALNGKRKIIFKLPRNEEKAGYNMMDNSSLDSTKLESLGWKDMFDLNTGTLHTLKIIGDNI